MKPKVIISKSQYLRGLQCPKALWLFRHRPDLKPDIPPVRQHLFDSGHEVGRLAQTSFRDGVEIIAPYNRIDAAVHSTEKAIRRKSATIFEAAAVSPEGAYSRIDIMHRNGHSLEWDLVEVKSTTGIKDVHLNDMAFQRYTFETAGHKIRSSILMYIDNTYVKRGAIDTAKLFQREDCSDIVQGRMSEVPDDLRRLKSVIVRPTEPEVSIGSHCKTPFACDYIPYCWQCVPDYSVYNLFSGRKLESLLVRGILDVAGIPDDFDLTPRQTIEVAAFKQQQVHMDAYRIARFLEKLVYPLYFLDYETIMPAIPLFEGTRPYQQVPFQFSLHVQKIKGGAVAHSEFLHTDLGDPRIGFVRRLVGSCGDTGSVVVYNRAFEAGVNTSLSEAFPAYSEKLSGINNRMIDLLVPFRSRALYHPDMRGSASLKIVLPAFVSDLSYDDLTIADGQTAALMYLKVIKTDATGEEKESILSDLRRYCAMDTLAEVKLLEVLYHMASE